MFDPNRMARDRPGPDHDRLIVAKLTAIAQRHAQWCELTEAETTAAVAKLGEAADGRTDLLAEVAGILLGAHEGELDEPRVRDAVELCRLAGADENLIPGWAEERRRRTEARRVPQFSRPGRRAPRPSIARPSRQSAQMGCSLARCPDRLRLGSASGPARRIWPEASALTARRSSPSTPRSAASTSTLRGRK